MQELKAEMRVTPTRQTRWRANAWRIAGMIAFALLLAGCDSCGDFVSPIGHAQVCRKDAPQPH